jgi:ABC-type transport system involved in multi-copper enzyme maturation permease subunit
MKQQIKTQLYLCFTGRFFYVICAIVILLSLSLEIVSYYAAEMVGVSPIEFTGFASIVSGITDFATTEIFCIIIAALFFGTEMKNRTVNIALTAGVSRLHYWLSKSFVYVISGFIIALLYPLTLCIFGTAAGGFGAEGLGFLYFLRLFAMYFFATISIISVYIVFSAIFSSTSAVVFSSLGFLFLFRIVTQVVPIFIKGSETVIGLLPSLSLPQITDPELSLQSGLTIAIIDILTAAILFAVSYAIFRKKELK